MSPCGNPAKILKMDDCGKVLRYASIAAVSVGREVAVEAEAVTVEADAVTVEADAVMVLAVQLAVLTEVEVTNRVDVRSCVDVTTGGHELGTTIDVMNE